MFKNLWRISRIFKVLHCILVTYENIPEYWSWYYKYWIMKIQIMATFTFDWFSKAVFRNIILHVSYGGILLRLSTFCTISKLKQFNKHSNLSEKFKTDIQISVQAKRILLIKTNIFEINNRSPYWNLMSFSSFFPKICTVDALLFNLKPVLIIWAWDDIPTGHCSNQILFQKIFIYSKK